MKIKWIVAGFFDQKPDKNTWLEPSKIIQRKFDIELISTFKDKPYFHPEIKISYLKTLNKPIIFRFMFLFSLFWYLLKQETHKTNNFYLLTPDAVYAFFPFLIFSKSLRHRILLDVRTVPVESYGFRSFIENFIFFNWPLKIYKHFGSHMSFITEEMYKFLARRKLVKTTVEKIFWSSAVNPEILKPTKDQLNGSDEFVLLYVGTMTPNRGLRETIQAIKILSEKKSNLQLKFKLAGRGNDLDYLRNLTKDLELENYIEFCGFLKPEQVVDFINQGHVGICPLPNCDWWNVSSPLKIFEYLSCERPVIVTQIPAHTNVLLEHKVAFWAKDTSPVSLADAILNAYQNRHKIESFGQNGRQLILKNYTWEKQASHLLNKIQLMLQQR